MLLLCMYLVVLSVYNVCLLNNCYVSVHMYVHNY